MIKLFSKLKRFLQKCLILLFLLYKGSCLFIEIFSFLIFSKFSLVNENKMHLFEYFIVYIYKLCKLSYFYYAGKKKLFASGKNYFMIKL